MTALRENIGLALANLYEIAKEPQAIDSAFDRRTALEKLCAETEAKLHQAREALEPVKAELGRVETDLNAKNRVLEDQRARSLAAINAQIEAAQGEHAALSARIEKTRREIVESDRSMGSLINRLRVV